MPDKKKIPTSKSTDKRMSKPLVTKPPAPKPVKAAEPPRSAAAARSGGVPAASPHSAEKQFSSFEAAMKLFHHRKFKEAREQFDRAAEGPERDVAHRARLHMAMCDRRLPQATVNLGSAEDYYNYGIALINTRSVVEARQHLEKALQIAPGSDHIHYALALAQALGGDLASAHDNLKRAIELEPRNRIIARQDADFAPLANQPPFDVLLYPEKKSW
jgi:tetratricopeptide (TPR) repeat protein